MCQKEFFIGQKKEEKTARHTFLAFDYSILEIVVDLLGLKAEMTISQNKFGQCVVYHIRKTELYILLILEGGARGWLS